MKYKIALLAGDGIGPEVMKEAVKVLELVQERNDVEFELKYADSTNIDKYKKWFRNKVTYLLNNKWDVDEQTKYEKPDSTGIVTKDEINFVWEHTGLKYKDKIHAYYLELSIDYGIKYKDKSKFFTFSVSEEHR